MRLTLRDLSLHFGGCRGIFCGAEIKYGARDKISHLT